jgi:hypothetical protein
MWPNLVRCNQPCHLFWLDSLSVIKVALDPVGTEDLDISTIQRTTWIYIYISSLHMYREEKEWLGHHYRGDPSFREYYNTRNQKSQRAQGRITISMHKNCRPEKTARLMECIQQAWRSCWCTGCGSQGISSGQILSTIMFHIRDIWREMSMQNENWLIAN